MASRSFTQRSETFGYDRGRPWAADTFALLFNVPRAYEPLVAAWDRRHPGVRKALDRLVAGGFVDHQPAILVDTVTGEPAQRPSRRVARYVATAAGRRAHGEFVEDPRTFEDQFPHTTGAKVERVIALLGTFVLDGSHARYGMSVGSANRISDMTERLGRWWVARFVELGLLRQLTNPDGTPLLVADVREVVPAHWRVTRTLCRQLDEIIDTFEAAPAALRPQYRLRRNRFLDDIEVARLGITGATDYDHDVETQRIIAAALRSPRCAPEGVFALEPKMTLPVDSTASPWVFTPAGDHVAFYQPDAELRQRDVDDDGRVITRRAIIEYERFQSRRDAWSHIERFLGHLALMAHPSERATLYFVVDTEARARSYVALIEAFADWLLDHPDAICRNQVTLAVAHIDRVVGAEDPLDPNGWARIKLPAFSGGADTGPQVTLHPKRDTPYDAYFGRL